MNAGRIRALFFDVGGTLVDIDYDLIAQLMGCGAAGAALREAEPQVRVRMNGFLAGAGRLTETPDTFRYMLTTLGEIARIPISEETFDRISKENARRTVWRVANPDAANIGAVMKKSGIRVGVISNSDGTVTSLLDECGFGGQFETVIDSAIVGVAKPDPEIFQIAMARMGVVARETAFVGDIPSVDIMGARAAGLEPILYDRAGIYREWAVDEDVPSIDRMAQLPHVIESL